MRNEASVRREPLSDDSCVTSRPSASHVFASLAARDAASTKEAALSAAIARLPAGSAMIINKESASVRMWHLSDAAVLIKTT
jgi:hypothetical protein